MKMYKKDLGRIFIKRLKEEVKFIICSLAFATLGVLFTLMHIWISK